MAAATFAVKAVVDPEMPVSHGFCRVVSVDAPVGSIVNPLPPAPVAGGNVEAAQRIVDVVLKALSKALAREGPRRQPRGNSQRVLYEAGATIQLSRPSRRGSLGGFGASLADALGVRPS